VVLGKKSRGDRSKAVRARSDLLAVDGDDPPFSARKRPPRNMPRVQARRVARCDSDYLE